MKYKIFISSVQKEFVVERDAIREYLQKDPFLSRYCEVFLFEDTPAKNKKSKDVWLSQVDESDVYVGLFGQTYGKEDEKGLSSTHCEYLRFISKIMGRVGGRVGGRVRGRVIKN